MILHMPGDYSVQVNDHKNNYFILILCSVDKIMDIRRCNTIRCIINPNLPEYQRPIGAILIIKRMSLIGSISNMCEIGL